MSGEEHYRKMEPGPARYLDKKTAETADLVIATKREMERLRRVIDSTREQIDQSRQIIAEWQLTRGNAESRLPPEGRDDVPTVEKTRLRQP